MEEKLTNIRCGGWSGPCESINASKVRMNTAYVDEDRNWVVLCPECCEECSEYWADMWADYYRGCL